MIIRPCQLCQDYTALIMDYFWFVVETELLLIIPRHVHSAQYMATHGGNVFLMHVRRAGQLAP